MCLYERKNGVTSEFGFQAGIRAGVFHGIGGVQACIGGVPLFRRSGVQVFRRITAGVFPCSRSPFQAGDRGRSGGRIGERENSRRSGVSFQACFRIGFQAYIGGVPVPVFVSVFERENASNQA